MIKGNIDQLQYKMNAAEIEYLINAHNKQEAINIMGKRYFITAYSVSPIRGSPLNNVIVKVRAIKKG